MQVRMHGPRSSLMTLFFVLLVRAGTQAQDSSDLGVSVYATLQWDHISSDYSGDTSIGLTNGYAGSCTADLTLSGEPTLKNVFTLQNCTAITPRTLSK